MNFIPNHAWWIIGVLAIFKIGIGGFLYHSRRRIRILETKEREAREGGDRLLRTLSESRATVGRLGAERNDLSQKLDTIMHAVVLLPLPPDLRSCSGNGITYLPRATYKGDGRVEVMIPGIYKYAYTLHINPKEQTSDERERIYEALRSSREARAELGIGIS